MYLCARVSERYVLSRWHSATHLRKVFYKLIIIMYAIVEIAGQQFKVTKDQKLYVHRLNEERGANVEFTQVLLVDADGQIKVGAPVVEGAKVVAEVVSHVKGEKVIVFKKKRRKGYRVKNGHRQCFTELVIKDVIA